MRIQNFGIENPQTLLDPDDVAKVVLNVVISDLTWQVIDVKVSDFKN